jgi:hypothetical protein
MSRGRACTICHHEARADIDDALVSGVPLRRIAATWPPVTMTSLQRHKQNHVSRALTAVHAERVEQGAATLLDRVEHLITRTERLLEAAEGEGRVSTALAAVRELRSLLELLGKASGELDDRPQVTVNLLASPEWLAVRDALFGALATYPEARSLVAGRLLALEAGPS